MHTHNDLLWMPVANTFQSKEKYRNLSPAGWDCNFILEKTAELEQRVYGVGDVREVMAAGKICLGYSPNNTDESELEEAKQVIPGIKPYLTAFPRLCK